MEVRTFRVLKKFNEKNNMPQIQLKLEVSPSPGDIAWWRVTVLTTPPMILNPNDFAPINAAGFFVWDNAVQTNGPTLTIQFHISPLEDTALADCYVFINTALQKHPLVCTAAQIADSFDYPMPAIALASAALPASKPSTIATNATA